MLCDAYKSSLRIAVVICTHDRPTFLDRCLQQLQRIEDPAYSPIVIDSAPNSSATKSVATRYGARYYLSRLKGLSRARNIGLRVADAEIIAFLDDDMVPHPLWLSSLVAEFTDDGVMAATGPMLPLPLTNACDKELKLALERNPWGSHHFQIDRFHRHWFERTNFGGIGDGNFAVRRAAFNKVSGFDERLGRGATIDGGEDHYAFFNLVDAGFKVAYTPQAIVFHPNSPITRDVLRKQVTDTIAFAAFLAWNHPSKTWRIVKFLISGIFRLKRWKNAVFRSEVISLSLGESLACAMSGLFTFYRSVRQSGKT